jgi:hypothetical protein
VLYYILKQIILSQFTDLLGRLWRADYEKPVRTLALVYPMFCRLSSAQPKPQNKVRIRCRAAAFPKMFLQVEIVTAMATEEENAKQLFS